MTSDKYSKKALALFEGYACGDGPGGDVIAEALRSAVREALEEALKAMETTVNWCECTAAVRALMPGEKP